MNLSGAYSDAPRLPFGNPISSTPQQSIGSRFTTSRSDSFFVSAGLDSTMMLAEHTHTSSMRTKR